MIRTVIKQAIIGVEAPDSVEAPDRDEQLRSQKAGNHDEVSLRPQT
jgi:hypothetical protein